MVSLGARLLSGALPVGPLQLQLQLLVARISYLARSRSRGWQITGKVLLLHDIRRDPWTQCRGFTGDSAVEGAPCFGLAGRKPERQDRTRMRPQRAVAGK